MLRPGASSAGGGHARRTPASCSTRLSRPCMSGGLSRAAVSCTIAIGGCNPSSSGRRNTLREEVAMTVRKRRSDGAGRGALPSPGRPSVARREDHRQFWAAIAAGRSSEDAAVGAGVSPAVGARWFRRAGGMPPSQLAPAAKPLSGRSLSFAEREEIAIWRAQRQGGREIARQLKRAPSTISRELRRNAATRSGGLAYRATTAQWHADRSARRPKSAKLAINEPLRRSVQDRLAGLIIAPNGAAVHGPGGAWEGPPAGAAAGPARGHGLEPGTDRPPPAARLPR